MVRIVQPKVEIIDFNPRALDLLLFTKATRLKGERTMADIAAWPHEKKLEELAYMRDTIKSSWEFCDYVFLLSNVSRVFTHQFVRTRTMAGVDDPAFGAPEANAAVASFAQEAQRTIDASGNGYSIPAGAKRPGFYEDVYAVNERTYLDLLSFGENYQDARSALSNGITTSIVAKISLRVLSDMAQVRLCTRAQGEYQQVFRRMRAEVYKVHPWTRGWIEVYCVNQGTCCFPRYKACPIQQYVFNPDTGESFGGFAAVGTRTRDEIKAIWEETTHEANPVAKDGKTM